MMIAAQNPFNVKPVTITLKYSAPKRYVRASASTAPKVFPKNVRLEKSATIQTNGNAASKYPPVGDSSFSAPPVKPANTGIL